MKHIKLAELSMSRVKHNTKLKKKVLFTGEAVAGLMHMSHIVLPKGSTAVEHEHEETCEVFYCISGEISFKVDGVDIKLSGGQCLIVDAGETHSIVNTPHEAEMVYFMNEPS